MHQEDIAIEIEGHHAARKKRSKRSKKKKKRKKRKKRHQKSPEFHTSIWQKIQNIFPKQPLYAWALVTVLFGLIFGVVSYVMPWLQGTSTCIVSGQNSLKMDTKIHSYNVYETRIICFVQIVISLLFMIIIQRITALPNNHQSKIPNIMRIFFLLYTVAIYFVSLQTSTIDDSLTHQAQLDYQDFSNISCSDSRFVINAEFTTWKQALTTSILLTFSSAVITIFRVYTIEFILNFNIKTNNGVCFLWLSNICSMNNIGIIPCNGLVPGVALFDYYFSYKRMLYAGEPYLYEMLNWNDPATAIVLACVGSCNYTTSYVLYIYKELFVVSM